MDWPSWITAIATVVALAIAIFMPLWLQFHTEKAERRERTLKARFLAIAIELELNAIAASLALSKLRLLEYLAAPPPGPWAPSFLQALPFETPPIMRESIDRLPILGEPAAPSILRLSAVFDVYNENVHNEFTRVFTEPGTESSVQVRRVVGYIEDVQRVLGTVMAQIEPMAHPKTSQLG